MVLDIFILSVLRAGPVHGYELKRRVQRPSLNPLSNNSLYPSLKRFEAAGAVTSSVEQQEGKPARKVYTITEVGRHTLTDLISTLPLALAANDEEFLVRLSFFAEITPANRRAILAARAAVLDAAYAQVATLLDESDLSPEREWRTVAMTRLITTIRDEREWISQLSDKAGE